MKILVKKQLDTSDKFRIIEIWNNEYPLKLHYADVGKFDVYLSKLSHPNHFLLTDEDNQIFGWACKFIRDDEMWFAILIDGKMHGKRFGSELLNALKTAESELNGWVMDGGGNLKKDGSTYRLPMDFYLKHGFDIVRENRLETEKISAVKITWRKS